MTRQVKHHQLYGRLPDHPKKQQVQMAGGLDLVGFSLRLKHATI